MKTELDRNCSDCNEYAPAIHSSMHGICLKSERRKVVDFNSSCDEFKLIQPTPVACVFESSSETTSATICKHCGREKWEHQQPTPVVNDIGMPSDEEIYNEAWKRYPQNIYNNGEDMIFDEGAKWLRDQVVLSRPQANDKCFLSWWDANKQVCSSSPKFAALQGWLAGREHLNRTKSQANVELYQCMFDGGKDKCVYKSKDFLSCVLLRKCEYANTETIKKPKEDK